MTTLNQKLKRLSPTRRRTIERRAAALIADEQSLQELRQALQLTQQRLAKKLGIGQDGVSRLEQRSDLLLSTLRSYVEALGGRLSLVAEFPNRPPVRLGGLAVDEPAAPEPRRRKPVTRAQRPQGRAPRRTRLLSPPGAASTGANRC